MRLIDADKIEPHEQFEALGNGKYEFVLVAYMDDIDALQPVDAVPVRHGRWIKKRYWSDWYGMGESYGYWYKCSECGGEVKGGYESCDNKFCRNCGADMRKDGDDGKTD